jgi:hypothetical protein
MWRKSISVRCRFRGPCAMRLNHPLWRYVFFISVTTLLWACSSRAQALQFQLSNSSSSSATLTGRFTPTVYVPAMSNLLVTIAGLHVFPGDAVSIQASVSIPDQNGGKMRVEKFDGICQTDDYFSALTQNSNFRSNNPSSRSWTSEMRYTPTDPQEDFFGRRMTGAFCPTISGVYQMVLTDVDDYVELWIARENPNTRSLDWTGGGSSKKRSMLILPQGGPLGETSPWKRIKPTHLSIFGSKRQVAIK